MDKLKLLNELEEKFKKMKLDLKFKSSLEELDKIFFVKDSILKDGFVSDKLSRQICYRIMETYLGWNDYLHSLIMPNPQNILNLSESKIFSQEEKNEIVELMKKIMEINSKNGLIGLNGDKKMESEFIDNSVSFWEKEFKDKLIKIMKKINVEWGKP